MDRGQSFVNEGVEYHPVEDIFCVHYEGDIPVPVTAKPLSSPGCYRANFHCLKEFPVGSRAIAGLQEKGSNETFLIHPSKIIVKRIDEDYHETLLLSGNENLVNHLLSINYSEANFVIVEHCV